MHSADTKAEPQFSQPIKQILTMLIVVGLVGTGGWLAHGPILSIVTANIYLNGVIVGVFLIGISTCFWQVFSLIFSVNWIEGFAMARPGHETMKVPRLLTSLATLLKSRRARMSISASSSRSILDSMAMRLDETREITRYLLNLLIFLGLLGTFYGLATTVPAVVETIRSLAPKDGQAASDIFGHLMTGLEKQLGGMGTAFSSSLLGLAGSLVVGLLDLFTGHAQARFYRDLEEWLSTITKAGFSTGDSESGTAEGLHVGAGEAVDGEQLALAFHRMAESIEELHKTFIRTEDIQTETGQRIEGLARAMEKLGEGMHQPAPDPEASAAEAEALAAEIRLLARIAEGQDKIAEAQGRIADGQGQLAQGQDKVALTLDQLRKTEEKVAEAAAKATTGLPDERDEDMIDAESRMRLRSIDVQLLRILEEMSAGRQDTIAELRADIASLNKSIRALGRKPPTQPQSARARG